MIIYKKGAVKIRLQNVFLTMFSPKGHIDVGPTSFRQD